MKIPFIHLEIMNLFWKKPTRYKWFQRIRKIEFGLKCVHWCKTKCVKIRILQMKKWMCSTQIGIGLTVVRVCYVYTIYAFSTYPNSNSSPLKSTHMNLNTLIIIIVFEVCWICCISNDINTNAPNYKQIGAVPHFSMH